MKLTFGIAMFLFILFGFISIIGAFWAQYRKKQKKLWIISILINAFLLVGSVVLYNNLLTPEEKASMLAQQEQRKIEQNAKEAQEPEKKTEQSQINVPKSQNSLPETDSPKTILTAIASKSLGKNFKRVEVNDFVDDSSKKIVLVHYKGHEGYDEATTRKVMFSQTADLFKELFAAGVPIQEATAFIYADMTGPSGSRESLAMKCQLKGSTAANINWGGFNKTKFDQYLDYVWITPGLRN